jgi:hypothetical protein
MRQFIEPLSQDSSLKSSPFPLCGGDHIDHSEAGKPQGLSAGTARYGRELSC